MPGACGIKAANFFYNVAPKNGRTLLMPPEMSIVSELLRPKKVKYRCKQMTWLGRVFGQNSPIAVRRDSGVPSMADLKNKKITHFEIQYTGRGLCKYSSIISKFFTILSNNNSDEHQFPF